MDGWGNVDIEREKKKKGKKEKKDGLNKLTHARTMIV